MTKSEKFLKEFDNRRGIHAMDCCSMQPQVERFYNLNEAAELLGIKVRTAREWVHSGKINAVKYPDSKLWFVAESEIRRIQNGNEC